MTDRSSAAYLDRLTAAVRERSDATPRVAILLGTGLGAVAEAIERSAVMAQADLPDMPVSTAAHHAGEIIFGRLAGVEVVAFSGRLHCYEGHSAQDVVVPVRLARWLGAEILIMGSAAGGIDPSQRSGEVVAIADHINLMGVNPLVGPNDERVGPRWPDMFATYDPALLKLASTRAIAAGWPLRQGVYAGVLGPNLETRAEYRMLRGMGADLVGMSTVPEAIAAVHCGLRTLALAVVTDMCLPDALEPANIERIIAAANAAEPVLTRLITDVVAGLAET